MSGFPTKPVGDARILRDPNSRPRGRITAQFWCGVLAGLVGAVLLGFCAMLLMPDRFAADRGRQPAAAAPEDAELPELPADSEQDSPSGSSAPSQGAEMPKLEAELEQTLWEQEALADAEEFARDVLGAWVPDDRRIDEALRLRANSLSRLKLTTDWTREVRRIRALCEKLRGGRVLTPYRDLRGEFVPTCEEGISIR